MVSMDPRVKQDWIDALRSGDYSQTFENLQDQRGFCCLGVLTDLWLREVGNTWDYDPIHQEEEEDKVLIDEVREWARLQQKDPIVPDEVARQYCAYQRSRTGPYTLSVLNDGGTTFEEIADIIEQNF